MLHEMREIALRDLLDRCEEPPETGMARLRRGYGEVLSGLLVEDPGKVSKVYVLQAEGEDKIRLESAADITEENLARLPFVKPSGSQSPAIGPVLKRTYKPRDKPPYGPSPKILQSSCKAFARLAETPSPWRAYFEEISALLQRKILVTAWDGLEHPVANNVLESAAALLDEKETVFLTVADTQGRWPGARVEYLDYLTQELAAAKYLTGATPPREDAECPLCGARGVDLYPNAVKGAGFNVGNADQAGAFSGLNTLNAWKNFGLCVDCADLLFIFKNHLLPEFCAPVAGEKALVLPALLGEPSKRQKFMREWREYLAQLHGGKVAAKEKYLLRFFAEQPDAQVVLHIVWAKFGQNVEDVKGTLSDVLPSRLQRLSVLSAQCNAWKHPLAPLCPVEEARFDLGLNMLLPLFRRPGGNKSRRANESKCLFDLKYRLTAALYHQKPLGEARDMLWREILETARRYFLDAQQRGDSYGFTFEGHSVKTGANYLTLAGWVRHLARFFYYLDCTGVLAMEENCLSITLRTETLKPFFTRDSGINSEAKAFAFVLGVLFGKLLQVQARKGVNINANALSWLKRLEISGKDLPELYKKVRGKFFAYSDFKKSNTFLDLEADLAVLGAKLGDNIELDVTATCYFLLLGQSVSRIVLPKKTEELAEEIETPEGELQ